MPLYEYRCRACGRTVEVLQKVVDRPLRKCEHCSGRLDKLISRTSFQLKGGGWYSDGYGGGGSGKPSKGSSSGKTNLADKSEKKSKGSTGKSGAD